ncbi:MAG: MBL fold metallo-hydrolase [Candidatus Delongbacteria bacterium]|nr:MBL fold metallo-hydrolase [Candidatus Delongbacteria bacterium]MCG2760771.1 MBL fold metallo-hydrolase [Candidatus Delongbacteria bacterium]
MIMKIRDNIFSVSVGPLDVNCIIVKCPVTSKIGIFDPGDDGDKIIKFISSIDGEPESIINTHCHYDHIGAVEELRREYKIPFLTHENEREYSIDPNKNYSVMSGKDIRIIPDGIFSDGVIINIGKIEVKVIHTPGHTLGSSCFHFDRVLISGDTLFAGSIGRTDLYGGNTTSIIKSIKHKLMILDEDTLVLTGHGRHTTIRDEKRFNPFL